jgi:hypothetical protein
MDVTLEAPGLLARSSVSKALAERKALALSPPGTSVRESVLTKLVDSGRVPNIDTLAWAVSVTPSSKSHGPIGARQVAFTFEVLFFDANTGAFIEGARGN